jgi:hypothetical protein
VRIGHLVEQLLGGRRARDAPAGAVDLAERRVAVGVDVGETEIRGAPCPGLLAAGIREIAAAKLAGAFEQMADRRAAPEAIPSSTDQPYSCIKGATNSDGSATRPVTTMSAPLASAGSSASAPRYALAETTGRTTTAARRSPSRAPTDRARRARRRR